MRRTKKLLKPFRQEASINLTPLIDVVFVVLIMFIVITPMLDLDHIELAGGIQNAKDVKKSEITIYVKGDNTLSLNQRPVSVKELHILLRQAYLQKPSIIPQIIHDKKATFGTYQEVKTAMEKAGYQYMDIIIKPS